MPDHNNPDEINQSSPAPPKNFIPRFVLALILVNLIVLALAFYSAIKSFGQQEAKAATTSQNLALVLDQSLSTVMSQVNLSLLNVIDEIERQRLTGRIDAGTINAFIERVRGRLPFLNALRVVDAQGNVVYGVFPGERANIADREFFIQHRQEVKSELVISDPVIGKISREWTIFLGRRLKASDGSFAGIVAAGIPLTYFQSLFASLDLGPNGGIALRDINLGMLVRYPVPREPTGAVGRREVSATLQRRVEQGLASGTYKAPAGLDKRERVFSYRRLSNYPLYIIVGLAPEDYLAGLKRNFYLPCQNGRQAKMALMINSLNFNKFIYSKLPGMINLALS